jgi:hypothetical protein
MNDYIDPTIPGDIQELLRKNLPYPPSNVVPKASIMGGVGQGSNTFAWVDPKLPSAMFINKERKKDPPFPKSGGSHELEHMLQFNVDGRYKRGYDSAVIDEYHKLLPNGASRGRAVNDLVGHLKRIAKNKPLRNYLGGLTGDFVAPYIGGDPDGEFFDLKEQFAELSAVEQQVKRDLTKDPYILENFFGNDQNLVKAYKGTTGLRTNRKDARDLKPLDAQAINPRYPAPPEKPQGFLDKLKAMLK